MAGLGGERSSVQNPIIKYTCEPSGEWKTGEKEGKYSALGWEYVSPDDALRLRGGETGFIFKEIFINQIKKLNPFVSDEVVQEIIKRLERIPPTIEGNFTTLEYLKGIRTAFIPEEKRERNIRFIDTENIANNIFQATEEFEFTNGRNTIRLDLVFLINGVPVIFVETKSAHKIEGMSEALEQVRRYHRECPEILAILQVYAITHIIKYYYSATWNTSIKNIFNWKEETQGNFETLVKTFFDKGRVVRLITDFILFTRQDDELKKVVLRPHQIRAVAKIVERAESEKRRGLVWHTQGSGKTYTMIVAAKKIMENPIFENPTVIMLVDRTELESQLFGNLKAVGMESVEVTESIAHLKKLLKEDKRGLIVTMIHKFEGMPANINTRKNIFVLVDEAHRTTGGKLGNCLMGALPNATYIGFTGTPIDRTNRGQGTFITFGKDDPPNGYLDKYSILESIEDGTTVPLHYTMAPNELRVDKETLEREFLSLNETEGLSDIDELNRVLEKAVNLKNMLKSRERVAKIAKYIADHFKETIEPMGYKAFLVAVDREACALYKEELDKHLPPEYSKVVYSPFYNDPAELAKYHLSDEEEKRIRKAFRKPDELPKILIVTEKLLTGFDAPILYCMYLDKPMRDHVLLQAIARVNRPYEDEEGRKKPSGFVLDFVGIFDDLKKALAFDSEDIEGVVEDIEVLKKEFLQKMELAREKYLVLIKDKSQDKAVEAVLDSFMDEERRHQYYQFFKGVQSLYDIISPDEFLRPFMDDIETLARMYQILRGAYEPGIQVDKDFTRKTARLVQEHTSSLIKPALDIYEIDENTLKKIEESKASDIEKVFNLLKSIRKLVMDEADTAPYLLSIGERAELIANLYKTRQISTQETLEELKKEIEEINVAKKEAVEKKMPMTTFTIYWVLKKEGFQTPERLAEQMTDVIDRNPYWRESARQESEVRAEFYRILDLGGDVDKISKTVPKLMSYLKSAR